MKPLFRNPFGILTPEEITQSDPSSAADVDHIEAVRGGSSSTATSDAPGGVIRFRG